MSFRKKIPYGISNFRDLIIQNYTYIDKTKYIEILENFNEKYIFFLRPRRFGKSLFISLLSNYYDINAKDEFSNLFKGLYIGENVTQLANSYYILEFNFSGIDTSSRESLLKDFKANILHGINDFLKKYNLQWEFDADATPAQLFYDFLIEIKYQINGKIYLLIDEYDHFANELLGFQVEVFEETISKTGFVRKWYEVLKIGTGQGIIDRIFATGVSPVALDGLTSGFNIAKNKTRDALLNEMLGFTEEEVIALCRNLSIEESILVGLVPELKNYYNGYLFSEDAKTRVFNSDMVLYYLSEYLLNKKPPKELIDTNISSDYAKLQSLFTLRNITRNYKTLESILNGDEQITMITREYSLAKEFTDGDFLSLLFYLGFLTIEKSVLNRVQLTVPNYGIRELYFNFFAKIISDKLELELKTQDIENSIARFALNGDITQFTEIIEGVLGRLAHRDFIKFDEKYIKLLFITYLMLSKLYYVKSEYEVANGFIDIAFFSRMEQGAIYEGLVELKYIKQSDYENYGSELVQQKLEEGKMQLLAYVDAQEMQNRQKLLKWVVIFAGDRCVEKVKL